MLDAADIDPSVLPALFESPAICARVSRAAAGLTGLPAGTPNRFVNGYAGWPTTSSNGGTLI